MDARYGGKVNHKKMLLSQFYSQHHDNIFVFGGNDLEYRSRLIGKHIETLYRAHRPAIVFFNDPQNIISRTLLYLKNELNDTSQRLIVINSQHPYYHPLLGMNDHQIAELLDGDNTLLQDEKAYLEAILTLIQQEKKPLKLHSLLEYINYDLSVLIQKCDFLMSQRLNASQLNEIKIAKRMFEEEKMTGMSSAAVRRRLKDLNFPIVNTEHAYCQYTLTTAIKNRQIICIDLMRSNAKLMAFLTSELATITASFQVILFDVNCSVNHNFEEQMLNTDSLSIYSDDFNRDFSSSSQQAVLGKRNTTLLFKMQTGSAREIVNYYGEHDYTYQLEGRSSSTRLFDVLHLHTYRTTNYQQHQERVNKLSAEQVSGLKDHFECFEVHDNDIIFHGNVSYENLI